VKFTSPPPFKGVKSGPHRSSLSRTLKLPFLRIAQPAAASLSGYQSGYQSEYQNGHKFKFQQLMTNHNCVPR
jgi:hypothetical protein